MDDVSVELSAPPPGAALQFQAYLVANNKIMTQ